MDILSLCEKIREEQKCDRGCSVAAPLDQNCERIKKHLKEHPEISLGKGV